MTEREKIIELATRHGADFRCGTLALNGKDADCFITAFYHAAQRGAFEQAVKTCGERADIFNKLYSREAAGAICCRHEIRQLIKE